jgi:glyoxylase-like metal-dependent hydrolase (beta-lactamase superfamily II)
LLVNNTMRRERVPILIMSLLLFLQWSSAGSPGAALRFEKVSDHCYFLALKDGTNVGVVVTVDGILMVNPPQEQDRALVAAALNRITLKAVRWVVFTDPRFSRSSGARYYAAQGAQLIAGARLRALSATAMETNAPNMAAAPSEAKSGSSQELFSSPLLVFDRQMHLFPSNIDIRIFALQHSAHTGGDVVVHVPADKVLFAGDLYASGCFPDINVDLKGDALGWIDGMKQVIDSIPVLKQAISQAKPEPKPKPKPEQEKTLEEGITVVSAHGAVSNLQNMKDLLEASQRLRNDISKAIKARRSTEIYLASPASEPYRGYPNFDHFAELLLEALSAQ